MNYWLVKQEPSDYSWDDFVQDGKTAWTGVRNYQARNNLKAMAQGDKVLFYHSVTDKSVMGVAEVAKTAYPDPTADAPQWVCVDLKPLKPLKNPVSLDQVKAEQSLQEIPLIRQSRLSVMPLEKKAFEKILQLGNTSL